VKRPYPAMGFANAGPREARSRKRCAPGRFVKKGSRQRATPLATLAISSQGPSRACDKRCPSRSGWGEAPLASDRVGRCRTKRRQASGGPWPVTLDWLCTERCIATHAAKATERKSAQAGCSSGRPEGRLRGVRADRGRARGSHRLQKSTGGVWPFSPTSEELVDHDVGSSLFARERRRGERAPEAESSAAKPRDRWRVPKKAGTRESDPAGDTLSMEGALGRESRRR